MELPQPPRPYGGEGRKATHDFLSLCGHSTLHHQDPRPPSSQGGKEEASNGILSSVERLPAQAQLPPLTQPPQPQPTQSLPSSVEHLLPGGIGTYSISHISYFAHKLPIPKSEMMTPPFTVAQAGSADRADDNSNCSSYTNSGFTLWEEPAGKKGKTGKENVHMAAAVRESEVRLGRWNTPDRPAQSSSNNNHQSSFSSFSSSQPSGPKNKSFMDMIKTAKGNSNQEDELDDDETEFTLKKESSPVPRTELRVKIDGKSSEQKANTPRSKHSATEQRRRSKINDRFQMLRSLIPHSDQKRDRASFLLEVIEYIQLLQDKVTKYEGSYQGWSHEHAKLMPLRNGERPGDSFIDQTQLAINGSNPTMVFAAKIDEDNDSMTSGIPRSVQNPSETDVTSTTMFKPTTHQLGIGNNALPFPISLHPNLSTGARIGGQVASASHGMATDFESKPWTNDCAALNNKLKEQELTVESGSISISNVYSDGLLNTLTQALQSSGVDLSQASISVQIELGKRGNPRVATTSPLPKDFEAASKAQGITRTRSGTEDSDQALKKLKTCNAQV